MPASTENPLIWRFFVFQLLRHLLHSDATTSDINGHEDSMCYHYYSIHMLRTNCHILKNWQRIWVCHKRKTRIMRFLVFQLSRHMLHLDAPTSEINGREAFMWYHYDEIHILRTNYHIQPNYNVCGYASKENTELCVFLFSSFRGTCCTLMPRLLK